MHPQILLRRHNSKLRKKIRYETTNDIAAIIVEPIQGTAGNIVPPEGTLLPRTAPGA